MGKIHIYIAVIVFISTLKNNCVGQNYRGYKMEYRVLNKNIQPENGNGYYMLKDDINGSFSFSILDNTLCFKHTQFGDPLFCENLIQTEENKTNIIYKTRDKELHVVDINGYNYNYTQKMISVCLLTNYDKSFDLFSDKRCMISERELNKNEILETDSIKNEIIKKRNIKRYQDSIQSILFELKDQNKYNSLKAKQETLIMEHLVSENKYSLINKVMNENEYLHFNISYTSDIKGYLTSDIEVINLKGSYSSLINRCDLDRIPINYYQETPIRIHFDFNDFVIQKYKNENQTLVKFKNKEPQFKGLNIDSTLKEVLYKEVKNKLKDPSKRYWIWYEIYKVNEKYICRIY